MNGAHQAGGNVIGARAFERVEAAAAVIRAQCREAPAIAVVLGSGFGAIADAVTERLVFEYRALPHWPLAEVEGHRGELVIGRLAGRTVAVLAGRAHVYEGHSPDETAFATRVMGRLGVRQLILTNAAGGINPAFTPGTFMVIDDHINLVGNPLIGDNDLRFGPRFPDMTEVYSRRLRAAVDEAAPRVQVPVTHGVYAAVSGPSYETPAEVRYLRAIGADAVGMSTVPEAIAARHMGLEVLGISCITNLAAGVDALARRTLSHAEVLATADRARDRFAALLRAIVEGM